MTSLVIQTPNGLFCAIASAVSNAVSSRVSAGSTDETSPMRSASAASMDRPVSMI